ncbi:SDR family NAD(P)-dependent oxidoreductase [Streptomyces sp. TRM 70351]|uniref:SDR family oxidoreductase n=1 Tax=Streptomyces sp. TRM 70351 TaxID=3116552 RepID=UPI002E7B8E6E|nr:SDR family NAD(P)-dependent oxidoreductase [Streptomyces sp. TRM 70351]MEE1930149.1 SDR family NAD(P)-dependent oxidoreductase [Streptomyces sp. TRM 70351]
MSGHAGTVLITGANRGSGRAMAEELHRAGWTVWGLNRTPSGLPWMREVVADLRSASDVAAAVAEAARGGGLDAVVANGVQRSLGRLDTLPLTEWEDAVAVNLTSIVVLVQAALPHLRARKGRIVLVGSHAGTRFFEGGAAYCATKAALKAVAEVLLLEERGHGVRTSLLSPGAVASLDGDESVYKLSTESVARTVRWVLDAPEDTAVGEIELRPARLPPEVPVTGLDRLQAV